MHGYGIAQHIQNAVGGRADDRSGMARLTVRRG
jgi:hypothetical protein